MFLILTISIKTKIQGPPQKKNLAQNKKKYHYVQKKNYKGKVSRMTLENEKKDLTIEIKPDFEFPVNEEDPSKYVYIFQKHEDEHFENLKYLEKLVENLNTILRSKIFGNLQTNLLVNKQQISYTIYKVINDVRKSYFKERYNARYQIYRIRDVIELIKNYTNEKKESEFEKLVDPENIEIDEKNLLIFEDLLNQISVEAADLWESIFSGLDLFFEDILKIHVNIEIDDAERIVNLMKSSINLVSFENGVLNKKTKKILDLRDIIIDNPKYDHINHMYNEEFHPELVSKSKKEGVSVMFFVWLVSLLLI